MEVLNTKKPDYNKKDNKFIDFIKLLDNTVIAFLGRVTGFLIKYKFIIIGGVIIVAGILSARSFWVITQRSTPYEIQNESVKVEDEKLSSEVHSGTESNGIVAEQSPFIPVSSDESGIKNNTDPLVVIKPPVISDVGDYYLYSYAINLNESAQLRYKDGIQYTIEDTSCFDKEYYSSDSDYLDGVLKSPQIGDNTIYIKIRKIFVDENAIEDLTSYVVKELDGNIISRGEILAPNCKVAIETTKSGTFKAEQPIIEPSSQAGYLKVRYHFVLDDDAKKTLENGFSIRIYNHCSQWLEDNPFYKTWKPGKLGYVGLTFMLDEDAFDKKKLEKSVYEVVLNNTGEKIFQGFIDVPNCR